MERIIKRSLVIIGLVVALVFSLWFTGKWCLNSAAAEHNPKRRLRFLNTACALGNSEARIMRGIELMKSSNYTEAKIDFDRAIKNSPAYPVTYIYRAELFTLEGGTKAALDDYNQALALLGPYIKKLADSKALTSLAKERGITVAAISRGLYSRLLSGRCALYASAGRITDAFMDASLALEISPGDPRMYAIRAAIYTLIDQQKHAEADIATALKLGAEKDDLKAVLAAYPRLAQERLASTLDKQTADPLKKRARK